MRRCLPALTGFTMFLAAALVTSAQSAPETLRPPANEQLLSQVHAKGEQIYSCKADGAQFAWTLKGVEAQLTDKDGKPFGKHYSAPTWEANDAASRGKRRPIILRLRRIRSRGCWSRSRAIAAAKARSRKSPRSSG